MEILRHSFVQRAILACILGGGALSAVGVFVTMMEIPFLGISMSHAAFLGAVAALLLGLNPVLGSVITCVVVAMLVGPMADRTESSSNIALAILFSFTMGLSFLLLAVIPGSKSEALNLIWGSILTVTWGQVVLLGVVFMVLLFLLTVFFKEIKAVLFSREIAMASGIPAGFFFYAVLMVCGLTIGAGLNIVGGLLIFALLINPASAAFQLANRLTTALLLAVLFGVTSCIAGMMFSCFFNMPTGAVIVLASSMIFLVCFMFSTHRKRREGRIRQ